ncbi:MULTISPECIES: rhodanese-like domain-containing protein [unclassified Mycolicibacterium]|uniref:MBL fold metallo-hydrolase n=1 Tax=unclassified Mycolicibacterium TaxID=2636767 RepID=UPI0012DC2E83|nr:MULTISPECIES: MBL fold metallo-hydrolase [unclassified Mycolicibacterium]MUL83640.1 MBL fold metallo-hydrolase [Mycolicibacterium sp. CBMA 329]MUL90631.1 MBL fold metallo-hydrolase [Mycolicibacterium sp. CBMA 331]MUM00601.1 MBL fold metallo-hydrolase [Mycolicibacterium sp. CBMA 334]MUM30150.1 MBL fold metallo-hydrolase [Mycolicibacterium sp. CBMA 295]MUM41575.1 MBL fold metallo-hydrolase [Mycolicibacterium sp. CBMA 247]
MKFIQYYLDCLSHASYLIGDETTGHAVVVDPQRDVSEYVADAEKLGMQITMVIETHFHADFLSGHLELAEATGAKIVYSSAAQPEFDHMGVEDGQRISLGEVELEFRHTPGHTPESMSIVIYEHADDAVPYGVLTGDTLFIGDVGRPDLLASIGFTQDELADKLYHSLHEKLLPLPDATRVYPAHGAGSACGKNLSTDLWSTMGEQKQTNYALRAPDKQSFIELVTAGQPPAPGYFVYDAILNRKDRPLLDEEANPAALDYRQATEAVTGGAMLVDGRSPEEFALGHLRNAINIGLAGRYAEFAGSVIKPDADIVLVTDPGEEREGKNRLARIGFDRVLGYLEDPERTMFEHQEDVTVASRLTANAFGERAATVANLQIVDVRNPGETEAGMIPGAVNIPVGQLPDRTGELDPARPTVVYCAGGYRSSVAASLLRQRGFTDVSDILGGYNAWADSIQTA